jgi:hypothetical protein
VLRQSEPYPARLGRYRWRQSIKPASGSARHQLRTRGPILYFQRVDEVTQNVTGSCGGLATRLPGLCGPASRAGPRRHHPIGRICHPVSMTQRATRGDENPAPGAFDEPRMGLAGGPAADQGVRPTFGGFSTLPRIPPALRFYVVRPC